MCVIERENANLSCKETTTTAKKFFFGFSFVFLFCVVVIVVNFFVVFRLFSIFMFCVELDQNGRAGK